MLRVSQVGGTETQGEDERNRGCVDGGMNRSEGCTVTDVMPERKSTGDALPFEKRNYSDRTVF